jgi:hypothetical protein
MTISENLIEFFKTGTLKNISYGLTHTELTNILGITEWTIFDDPNDKYPLIYKFGRLEFYFGNKTIDGKLYGIIFQPIPSPADNGNLKFNYKNWTKNTDLDKASEFLRTNNIKFEEQPYNSDKNVRLLLTEGKVHIFFDRESVSEPFFLHKAGKFIDL